MSRQVYTDRLSKMTCNLLDWKDLLLASRSKIAARSLTLQLPASDEMQREDSGAQSQVSPEHDWEHASLPRKNNGWLGCDTHLRLQE